MGFNVVSIWPQMKDGIPRAAAMRFPNLPDRVLLSTIFREEETKRIVIKSSSDIGTLFSESPAGDSEGTKYD